VQGDDGGYGGEAELEARPGYRFRPKQQHQQRPDRDQPHADRLPPQCNAAKHQKGSGTAAHRRHLHACQQGVADPRQGPDGRADQHEIEAEREVRA